MVVTFICARDHTPHVARGRKTLQNVWLLYKHGKTAKDYILGQIRSILHAHVKIIVTSAPINYFFQAATVANTRSYMHKNLYDTFMHINATDTLIA